MSRPRRLLVAIDAGLRTCGVAMFATGVLVAAFTADESVGRGPAVWRSMALKVTSNITRLRYPWCEMPVDLVIEVMQEDSRSRGNVADILEVQGVAGAISSHYLWKTITGYTPRQWKGSVPKTVSHLRARRTMCVAERDVVEGLDHNGMDAVALGLFHLKRK